MASSSTGSFSQTALDLVYWRNEKQTAAVVALGLLTFVLLWSTTHSMLTLLSYLALGHLLVRFVYRNAMNMLAEIKVVEKRTIPKPPDVFVTEAEVQAHLTTLTASVNSALHAAYALAVCDCNATVFKWMGGLFVLSILSKLLGTVGFFFCAFAAAFSLPKVYELKKPEIDSAVAKAADTAADLSKQCVAKLSALMPPKASDLKAKAKSL